MRSSLPSVAAAAAFLLIVTGCAQPNSTAAGASPAQSTNDWCAASIPDSAAAGAGFTTAKFGVSTATKADGAVTVPTGVQCFWTSDSGNISVGRLDFSDEAGAKKYMDGLSVKIGAPTPNESGQKVEGFDQLRAHLTPQGIYFLYLRQGSTIYRGGVNGCSEEENCGDSMAGLLAIASKSTKPALPSSCAAAKGDAFKLVVLSNSDDLTTYFGLVGADGKATYVVHDSPAAVNLGYVAIAEPATSSEATPAGPTSINGIPVDLTGQHLDSSGYWLEKPWAISVDKTKSILPQVSNSTNAAAPFVPGSMVVTEGAACTIFD